MLEFETLDQVSQCSDGRRRRLKIARIEYRVKQYERALRALSRLTCKQLIAPAQGFRVAREQALERTTNSIKHTCQQR